jgi:hypothetical protein
MIDPKYYGLIELVLFGVVVLGFAGWQLWSVRDAGKSGNSPSDTGHPEREHEADQR